MRGLREGRGDDQDQDRRGDALRGVELPPHRAQAGRWGDHRLDRDHHRGASFRDRPDGLRDRTRLGPQGG